MKMTDLTPVGRVPKGEPGFDFYRSKAGTAVPPLQKGVIVASESMQVMDLAPPAAFLEGGDYIVYGGYLVDEVDGESVRKQEHVAVALRDGDTPFAWVIQLDQVFQGDAAKELMPSDFRWTLLKPDSVLMDMRRTMIRARIMYPEIKQMAMIVDLGDGPRIESADAEFADFVRKALLREN